MTIGQNERRVGFKPTSTTRRFSGRRTLETILPDDARDLLDRAEKLVYLFPDGFDHETLVADQTATEERIVFDFDALVEPQAPVPVDGSAPAHTFVGRVGESAFAIEVRPRSATIIADIFGVRRDLLLVIKEYAERREREEGKAA